MFKSVLNKLGLYLVSLGQPAERHSNSLGSQANFQRRGRNLLSDPQNLSPTVMAGSIELVGLEDVKQALGADWPDVAGQVCALAETVIRKHLTDTDIYTRHGNSTFVLCFPQRSKTEATQTARLISAEIKAALAEQIPKLGQSVGVSHFVAEVEKTDLTEDKRPLADALLDSLSQMRQEAEESVRQHRAAMIRDARVMFRPVWHTSKRAILLYRCLLDNASGASALQHFEAISDPDQLQTAIAELDCLVLSHSVKSLHALLQQQSKAILVIPIHFQTAATKTSRDEYLKLCQNIPESYRKFIFLEIHGSPVGTPASRTAEVASILKPVCHGVIIENPPSNHGDLSTAILWGVSLNVGDVPSNPDLMSRAVTLIRAQNLFTIIHGVNSIAQLHAAVNAGFDYIDGEAVHASLDEPRAAFKFNPPGLGRGDQPVVTGIDWENRPAKV